nr:FAD/NAD(P)-binding protein [Actinomycetota bacterium]
PADRAGPASRADPADPAGPASREIRPTDFLPRRVLGEYLGWFLDQVRQRAPEHVRITMHRAVAVDLISAPCGGLDITLSDGNRVHCRYAFLTTGYTGNEVSSNDSPTPEVPAGHGRFISEPYPLPDRLAQVRAAESVAIAGFGLSAMDVMSCLTVGRGGRFVEDASETRYLPSGREPMLVMYSRSGLAYRARPRVVEFGASYQPLAFTRARIDTVRSIRGGPLDFDSDVLPLVLTEMRIAYRRCQARRSGSTTAAALAADLADADGPDAIDALLDELDSSLGRFDAQALFDGASDMLLDSADAYQKWLADVVRVDLAEGVLGFAGSPVKGALDILRELRDTFRYAVDFGGLTGQSLERFMGRTVAQLNRAVVGPQYERHAELLALLSAGVLSVPFGPAPRVDWNDGAGRWRITSSRLAEPYSQEVDWLVSARTDLPGVESSASPLIRSLHRKGWIRPHRPTSRDVLGIDVNPDQHPLNTKGQPDQRVWVLGPLCEGATFYNNLVPSPNVYSRPVYDAHRCVVAMLAAHRAEAQQPSAVTS